MYALYNLDMNKKNNRLIIMVSDREKEILNALLGRFKGNMSEMIRWILMDEYIRLFYPRYIPVKLRIDYKKPDKNLWIRNKEYYG
jgi:hypothetical protein